MMMMLRMCELKKERRRKRESERMKARSPFFFRNES